MPTDISSFLEVPGGFEPPCMVLQTSDSTTHPRHRIVELRMQMYNNFLNCQLFAARFLRFFLTMSAFCHFLVE